MRNGCLWCLPPGEGSGLRVPADGHFPSTQRKGPKSLGRGLKTHTSP